LKLQENTVELNKQQVIDWLRVTLAAGGPIAALILSRTGISQAEYALYFELAVAVLPGLIVAVWGWYRNRKTTQIKITEQLPEVATVVIKDEARGKVGELAQNPGHEHIVTETQNEFDAKQGVKV
jgi:hypothetical protein